MLTDAPAQGEAHWLILQLYVQIVNDVLVPRWGTQVAGRIKPKQIKSWLKSFSVEPGTRDKYKTVMGTVYTFAQSEGLLPLASSTIQCTTSQGFHARPSMRLSR